MPATGRQSQAWSTAPCATTERRRAELTTLYRLLQQHAASFIAHTEARSGAELPRFIKEEFDALLKCGILAHGLPRLRCGQRSHDKLLAFGSKRRRFGPSRGARRMSQTAAQLADPHDPTRGGRRWMLQLPIPLNALGFRRIMFSVDDLHAVVARMQAHGAIGQTQYGESHRLAYIRGPEGIIIAVADQLA